MDMGLQHNGRELVISPSTSSVMTIKDGTLTNAANVIQSPYVLLQEHVTQVLERLRGSDIRALNRRLKRAFDIIELSSMSNSVIDNILIDIETLESRFLWINSNHRDDLHLNGFFPLLEVLKDMLKELGVLRTTMNELQVEYVKKVQESEVRVEQEILNKRLKKQQPAVAEKKVLTSWISNLFSKSQEGEEELSKSITNSSTLIYGDEDELRKDNNNNNKSRTRPLRRQIPHYASSQMTTSNSNGTNRSSPSIPIRNKRSSLRMPIDYEGIGPASIRPIPSDPAVNFSSSWLGGK